MEQMKTLTLGGNSYEIVDEEARKAIAALSGGGDGSVRANFSVVAYPTAEEMTLSAPDNNTIGIVTEVDIMRTVVSPVRPSDPAEGTVWISIGDSGTNTLHALNAGGLEFGTIFLQYAEQYVNGEWIVAKVMIYQNSEWKDWITYVYLYNSGDECVDITGGWTTKAIKWDSASESTAKAPTLSKNETNMVMGQSGSKYCGFVHTVNKINISGCKTICFKGIMYNDSGGTNAIYFARFVLLSKFGTYAGENHVARVNNNLSTETQTYCIDLSGVTETEVYVAFQLYDKASHITVEKVWLEK